MISLPAARVVFAVCAALAALAAAQGLTGAFLLDDESFLAPISRALSGQMSLSSSLLQDTSGLLGRSVTLASFGANAALCGLDPSCLRAGNIAIHLVNGLLVALLLGRIVARDRAARADAQVLGWLAAAAWVSLPLHTAAVLYIAQRLALLSATFVFAGLITFIVARERIERGRGGTWLLLVGVPALTALAMLAKENGALLPLLCLVLELTLFAPEPGARRPASVGWFFRLALFVPLIAAGAWLATHFSYLGDYSARSFTAGERVLTQGRVLWDYAIATFVPDPGRVGVFQDDYGVSRGFFDPPTTALAWVAWLVVVAAVLRYAHRLPLLAAGVGLFLAGHALESAFFALEIYYAHRNYLPSVGLVLGALALLSRVPPVVARRAAVAVVAWVALSLWTTLTIARAWADLDTLLAHEAARHPASLRLHAARFAHALGRRDAAEAFRSLDGAAQAAQPADQRTVAVWRLLALCETQGGFGADDVALLARQRADHITRFASFALGELVVRVEPGTCAPEQRLALAAVLREWLDTSVQPPDSAPVAKARYVRARLLASGGNLREALRDIRLVFDARRAFSDGVLAFQIAASLGDHTACREVLAQLDALSDWRTPEREAVIANFAASLPPAP